MKKYFAHLRPLERRLAVGVVVVLILVLNFVFIWPHFSDWSQFQNRLKNARATLVSYQATILQATNYQAQVKAWKARGNLSRPKTRPSISCVRFRRKPKPAELAGPITRAR